MNPNYYWIGGGVVCCILSIIAAVLTVYFINKNKAPSPRTGTWSCMLNGQQQGDPITVSWADKAPNGDITAATWACNQWISACGNASGGCTPT